MEIGSEKGKVVHIITRFIRAGADENTLLTCKSQTTDGYKVYLIYGQEHDRNYIEENDRSFHGVLETNLVKSLSPVRDVAAFVSLYRSLKEIKPQVVHTHTSKAGIIGRWAAFFAGVPVIVHGVHIAPFKNVGTVEKTLYWALEKLTAPITHAYFDVSEGMRAAYLDAGIGDDVKHTVVHSGFDLARFQETLPTVQRAASSVAAASAKPKIVVMVAAFTKRKRQLELIRHFQTVLERVPEARLHLCGEGELHGDAMALINELGLQDKVKLLGFRSDVENVIATADLCVLCSEREGLPRVVMQYLACGKPCIVTRLPGIEEVVQDGTNGLIIEPDRLDVFCDKIADVLSDDELLQHLRAGAMTTDLSSWDASLMWPRMKPIYNNLLSSRSYAMS